MMIGQLKMQKPESLPKFYVDFSLKNRVISFSGAAEKGCHEENVNPLISIKICYSDIKTAKLISSTTKEHYHQLTIDLEKPLEILSTTRYHNETVVRLCFKFDANSNLLTAMLGDKFKVNLNIFTNFQAKYFGLNL